MICQNRVKVNIVLWMMGVPLDKWRLLDHILRYYPVGYTGYGDQLSDRALDIDDLTSEWKLALNEAFDHFERPEIREKFQNGMPVKYGFFLTKAVWNLTQRLENAGSIPKRPHTKAKIIDGKKVKAAKRPARHGSYLSNYDFASIPALPEYEHEP